METFQDIYEAKFKPYVNKYIYEIAFDNNDKYAKILKSITTVIDDIDTCTELILCKKNIICLMIGLRARMFVQKYEKDRSVILVKPKLLQTGESFFFEAASPFIEKFNRIIQAGIVDMKLDQINNKAQNEIVCLDDHENEENLLFDDYLFIITLSGCFISCVVFIAEFLIGFKRQRFLHNVEC